MTDSLKIQYKLEKQAQRSAKRTARTEFRRELQLQRLQLKHEREIIKTLTGFRHKQAEEWGKFGEAAVKPLGDTLVELIRTFAPLVRR
jgi:hypothetical protein